MQSLVRAKSLSSQIKQLTKGNWASFIPIVVLVVSAAAALVAIFPMAAWAEASALHHSIVHVIIFLSGVGVGGSILSGYHTRRAKSDES